MMIAFAVLDAVTGQIKPDHFYDDLNTWGTYVGTLAIVIAAAAALYFANSSKRARAKGYLGIRLWNDHVGSERRLVYCVTNVGDTDLRVDAFMLRFYPRPWERWRKRSKPISPTSWRNADSTPLPTLLHPGESAVAFSDTPDTAIEDLAAFFAEAKISPRTLRRRLRAFAYTPWGPIRLDVEKTFLDRLIEQTARATALT